MTTSAPLEAGLERYVGLEHLDPDSLHIKRWGLIADGTSFSRTFTAGQVLFGKRRAYQRKAAVAEFDGVCSGDILVFEAMSDHLLPELLPFIVQSDGFFAHALGTSAGSLSPRTKWRDLANYEFALPPLDEQRRIAEILWAADGVVSQYLTAADAIAACKETYMHEQFSSLLEDASDHNTYSVTLGSVLSYASDGPFGSKLKTEHYSEAGARVIRLQNIGEGVFLDEDKAYIPDTYYRELSRYALQPKDILVAGLGDETHPVGRVCQVPQALGPAVNKADCFCLRVDESIVEAEYILHFLNSASARQQVSQVSQGTTRLRVNVTNLKTISIPIPDRVHQLQICSVISALEDNTFRINANARYAKDMTKILRETLLSHCEATNV